MMRKAVGAENNLTRLRGFIDRENIYLFYDNDKGIFRFLFLLLLFWKEAGNTFVENQLRINKINIKNPGQTAGILVISYE
jgi:hypothetical protein